jgi:hypothetical protein
MTRAVPFSVQLGDIVFVTGREKENDAPEKPCPGNNWHMDDSGGIVVKEWQYRGVGHTDWDDILDADDLEDGELCVLGDDELDSSGRSLNGICSLYAEHPGSRAKRPVPPYHLTEPEIPLPVPRSVMGIVFGHDAPYFDDESRSNPPTRYELEYGGPGGLEEPLYR